MSSGQPLTDLKTYWINVNDTNGTRTKKCKRSSIHKTFTNPTYINRVKCVTDTLNSIAKNNTQRIHLLDTKQYRKKRVIPLNDVQRAAAAAADAAAAAADADDQEEEEEEEEENNNASPAASPAPPAGPPAALPASAPASASAPPSAAAPPPLPRSLKAKHAAAAAAAFAKFKSENLPKKINEIFNGNTLKKVSDLIKEKCFSNNQTEFDKVPITLDLMATDDTKKPIYTILFDGKLQYNGKRYILKEEDDKSFSIKEISAKSGVKVGSGRRKTQKKNKHKKRTTSKRR